MWIFLNDAFMSAVEARGCPGMLVVRGRRKQDLTNVFGRKVEVKHDPQADYAFRVVISKTDLKDALAREVDRINYPNFKNSIPTDDPQRHDAYVKVWTAMFAFQREDPTNRQASHPYDAYARTHGYAGPIQLNLTKSLANSLKGKKKGKK